MLKKIGVGFLVWSMSIGAMANTGEDDAKRILNSDGFECPEGLHPDERGWWWGCVEPEKPEPKPVPKGSAQTAPTEAQKQELCENPSTWDAKECGFVNPNKIDDYKKAFEFQQAQQRELSRQMVINPTDERAVMEYQKYNKWWLKQSVMTSKTWKYNLVQNPEMDHRVKNPVSTFGLRMAAEVKKLDKENVFKTLKEEGAFFVWFTRSDCHYCHSQAKLMQRLPKRTGGLKVYNTSLDDKCIDGFEGEYCRTFDKQVETVAGLLDIKVVPTLLMFIPNDTDVEMGGTWLKIAHGITSGMEIENRSYEFFKAHASAIKKGLSSALSGQPAMDFDYQKPTGVVPLNREGGNESKTQGMALNE